MELLIKREEKQKEAPAKQAGDTVSQSKNATASVNQQSGERTHPIRKDPRAAQKLARKKRMKAAHRRRLKASYTKG